jgi:hypothetical protein
LLACFLFLSVSFVAYDRRCFFRKLLPTVFAVEVERFEGRSVNKTENVHL